MPDTPTPGDEAIADSTPAPAPSELPANPIELSPSACAARLAELFPALFNADGPPKPIKLRIQVDIQARAPGVFTKRVLSLFLSRHTTSTAYIKALLQAPHRFDLDGQPAGEISELHRAAATEELARRREIVEARRAAERDARRDAAARERKPRSGPRDVVGTEAGAPPRRDAPRHLHPAMRAARPPLEAAAPQAPTPLPVQPPPSAEEANEIAARRERAALLRIFETSTLTKANFCVLKRLAEPELDALLVQARQERERQPREPAPNPAQYPPPVAPPRGPRPEGLTEGRRGPPRQGGGPGHRR
jgi:sRNA-binding protein